jgi:hypothetical protein
MLSDEEIKDAHVIFESVRSSFSLLVAHTPGFIVDHISFKSPIGALASVDEFWLCMGVGQDWLPEFVRVNPRWVRGYLIVNEICRDEIGIISTVSSLLLYSFKIRTFSESRWVTIGPCSQALARSMFVGLVALVKRVRADPACSDYHLHGFARLTPQISSFIVVTSMCSRVADGMLGSLMSDDRVAQRLPELEAKLAESLEWVSSRSMRVWNRVANVLEGHVSGFETRGLSTHAAHAQASYMQRRFLDPARQ